MKKTLSALIASAVLVAPMAGYTQDFTPEQQEKAQMCVVQGVIAKQAMTYRQQGLKKKEAQKKLKAEYLKPDSSKDFSNTMNVMFNGFITMAYNEPIAKTTTDKAKATSDFFYEVTRMCMKELVGVDIGDKE